MNELMNKHANPGEIKEKTNKRKREKLQRVSWYEKTEIEGQI